MSDVGISYIEHQIANGIDAVQYLVTDEPDEQGVVQQDHTHDLYLRDDVPIATNSAQTGTGMKGHHAHSITVDSDGNLVCEPAGPDNHVHDKFTVVSDG